MIIDYRVPEASGTWKGESAKGRDTWGQFQLISFWLQEPCLLLRTGHFGPSVPTAMCSLTWGALVVFIFTTYPLVLKLSNMKALSLTFSWAGLKCVNGSLCTQEVYYLRRERIGICTLTEGNKSRSHLSLRSHVYT